MRVFPLFLSVFFIIIFTIPRQSEAVYNSWAYKTRINVNNPTGLSRTDYPVRIEVPAKTFIDAGRMNSDLRDIRFSDGTNELPFWIHVTEDFQRAINNIPVYVKIKNFNPGDNIIFLHFDSTKTKNDSPPGGSFCGDHLGDSDAPFGHDDCGDNTFDLFAFDCNDSGDWNRDSGCKGSTSKQWASKSRMSNSFEYHFRTHAYSKEFYAYFLSQTSNQNNLSGTDGYRLFMDYNSSASSDTTYSRYKYYVRVQKREGGGSFNTVSSGSFLLYTYNNSIQDFDIKVTSTGIKVYVNGTLLGSVNRSDGFATGYVGFDRLSWNSGAEGGSKSTDGISPIWVVDNYIGSGPQIEFLGNSDIEMKRSKPTLDPAYAGSDVIESMSRTQILGDTVDGNTLEQYIYSTYPLASLEDQVFEYKIKVKNRGSSADTINMSLAANDLTKWYIAYKYGGSGLLFTLPTNGTCSASLTAGCVDLAAGGSQEITIFVMPSAEALFDTGDGKLVLDINVNSDSDLSFDNVRFVANIRGKSGCYWKWNLPVTVTYNDTNTTGDLVDYQVPVTISGVSELSDALSGGEDILFTDSSGSKIPFWKKSFNQATGDASFWVNVPKVTAGSSPSGATTINMWWGNPNYLASLSDKERTFDMWEDWEDRTVGEVVGCPDNTAECVNVADDPGGWQNNTQPQDFFNWWTVQNTLDGKGLKTDAPNSKGSSDFGPIAEGGDGRWIGYEVMYDFFDQQQGTHAQYNPVYFQDSGNLWGMEFYSNKFIFRPFAYGTDWTWIFQTNATNLMGSYFPQSGSRYYMKVRLFTNPSTELTHLKLLSRKNSAPADLDSDTGYTVIGDMTADPAFNLDGGSIGFGGWDGGASYDNVRVRKFTEPEPTTSAAASPSVVSYSEVSSLSNPSLSPPLFNGRSIMTTASLVPFKWQGNLTAVYADCFINGDCKTGENQAKLGTISLWGKIDDDTPKGLGDHLVDAVAGDENRASPATAPGNRYIFTVRESASAPLGNCTNTTTGDCLPFAVSQAATLTSDLGASSLTEAQNLIKFARGQYIASYTRSTQRDQTPNNGTRQWKLNDIVHSNPLLVGIPNMSYADSAYNTFQSANNSRDLVGYFLSNEGMLHAVRMAEYDSTLDPARYVNDANATELWAFVPGGKLSQIKDTTDIYHEYTADGLLRAIDIKTSVGTYKTVLVGGLRTGGALLFAMDVTSPDNPKLMWEINETTNPTEFAKIGETYASPALGRLCETETAGACSGGRWVAILGSGFDTNDIANLSKNAYVTIVDLEDGSIIRQVRVSTKNGNITTDMAVFRDSSGFVKKVVFGDYYGAVWRLDLSEKLKVDNFIAVSTTDLGNADMLFKPSDYATSDVNTVAPDYQISAQPKLGVGTGGDLWIYVGSGLYDLYDASYPQQYFYALKDRASITPYEIGDLVDVSNSLTAANAVESSWYIQFGTTDSKDMKYTGTGTNLTSATKDRNERVLTSAEIFGGFVFFTTFTPDNSACGGEGTARFYGVNYKTGLLENNLMVFDSGETNVRSVALSKKGGISSAPMVFVGKDGNGQLTGAGLVNTSTGGLEKVTINPLKFSEAPTVLFWREVR